MKSINTKHKEYYQESVLNEKNLHRLKDVTMCMTTVAVYNVYTVIRKWFIDIVTERRMEIHVSLITTKVCRCLCVEN